MTNFAFKLEMNIVFMCIFLFSSHMTDCWPCSKHVFLNDKPNKKCFYKNKVVVLLTKIITHTFKTNLKFVINNSMFSPYFKNFSY